MNDWEQRAKQLENKVSILQETLETVKKMQLSSEMARYIRAQESVSKLVDLINLASDKPEMNLDQQRDSLRTAGLTKQTLDNEIKLSLKKSEKLVEEYACDPRLFGFELESGIMREYGKQDIHIESMSPFVGKGVRITSYHGKNKNVIVIPEEIEGYPVISIGKGVFSKMPISNIILPKTLNAIYDEAFRGCRLLKHIDLPEQLVYLGEGCFYDCGLEELSIPSSVEELPTFAFAHSSKLSSVNLNEGLRIIGHNAFMNCPISKIKLPETIEELRGNCFSNTKMTYIILPEGTKTVHPVAFANTGNTNAINQMICVFLGPDTAITPSSQFQALRGVRLIYCLPDSEIEKHARQNFLITKSLSELEGKK